MSETKRCEVCDWPLAATMEEGCVEGNCSYRPHEGTDEYFRIRKRREELAKRAAEPSPEVAPVQACTNRAACTHVAHERETQTALEGADDVLYRLLQFVWLAGYSDTSPIVAEAEAFVRAALEGSG